ncbi:MAG: response regulator [Bacteroidia bacterium]|nr:response regulator [Bacteroidia bacterium]
MKKILIIEDELKMLEGLKDNLEFEGYEVDTATEGSSGLQKVMQNQFDLILLDVMLIILPNLLACASYLQELK